MGVRTTYGIRPRTSTTCGTWPRSTKTPSSPASSTETALTSVYVHHHNHTQCKQNDVNTTITIVLGGGQYLCAHTLPALAFGLAAVHTLLTLEVFRRIYIHLLAK